jgi:HAD superfamily hydrolase (TIGR01509 family)
MIKAIVFDCFGVLVGSSFRDVYRASGGDPEKDADFIKEILGRASAGLISSAEICRLTAKQLGISVETFSANLRRMEQPNEALLVYIRSVLKPHYKVGMLSNAERGGPQRHLKPDQLAVLDVAVVSGEVGFAKPDPEVFQITADRLGVAFDEMIFVDDLTRYVEPARALGIRSIQYTDFESLKRELSDILSDKKELL